MTKEELLAEEYICNGKCQDDITRNYVHCKTCTRLKDFLAGYKAGKAELEKEIAELKVSCKIQVDTAFQMIYEKDDQLTKAKDLLLKLSTCFEGHSNNNFEYELIKEAEQFLKEEFTTELPNEWHNLKKNPHDLPKKDGLYLIARANDQGPEYDTVRYWTADQKFTGAYLFEEKPIAWLEIPAFKEEEK